MIQIARGTFLLWANGSHWISFPTMGAVGLGGWTIWIVLPLVLSLLSFQKDKRIKFYALIGQQDYGGQEEEKQGLLVLMGLEFASVKQ